MNTPPEQIWVYPKEHSTWLEQIIREFHIHPITAQIWVSRGFQTPEQIHQFLYSKLPDLIDPKLFCDMPKAARRILRAIKKGEGILIYGDNDVDGMTGTALLAEFLKKI